MCVCVKCGTPLELSDDAWCPIVEAQRCVGLEDATWLPENSDVVSVLIDSCSPEPENHHKPKKELRWNSGDLHDTPAAVVETQATRSVRAHHALSGSVRSLRQLRAEPGQDELRFTLLSGSRADWAGFGTWAAVSKHPWINTFSGDTRC